MCKDCTRLSATATNASVSPFRFGISSLSNTIACAVRTLETFAADGEGPDMVYLIPDWASQYLWASFGLPVLQQSVNFICEPWLHLHSTAQFCWILLQRF